IINGFFDKLTLLGKMLWSKFLGGVFQNAFFNNLKSYLGINREGTFLKRIVRFLFKAINNN
uniref:hypothetical protein n=1 Tax=Borreliella afzelii TaxID=29518 RepID=UPI003AF8E3DF